MTRTKRSDVQAIITATMQIEITPDQEIYETPGAWEIWQKNPLARIKRLQRDRVLWIMPNKPKEEKS